MIMVEFYRYVPTLKIVRLKKDHLNYNVFNVLFDHATHNTNELFPLYRASNIARKWLDNHYGFCKIYVDAVDEYQKNRCTVISNRKRFIREMAGFNVKVTIKRK